MKGSYWVSVKKKGGAMRRFGILVPLICFVFTGFLAACTDRQREQKEEYQKQIEAKLKEFNQKREELKAKAADLKKESREEFNQQMEELKKKQEAAKKKLEEVKAASAKAWEKLKVEMDTAIEDLNKLYDTIMSHFRRT